MIRLWHWAAIILACVAIAAGQVISSVYGGTAKTGGIALGLLGGAVLLGVFALVGFSGLPRRRTDRDAPSGRPGKDGAPRR
jgi:hypothetical protein